MKLLVLGATGPTGRHFTELALRSGDEVTAFVRNPAGLGDLADKVMIATGDATSEHDVTAAAAGHDAIVSCLGRSASIRADGLFTRAARAVVGAAKEAGIRRLVWLSSFGVGESNKQASLTQRTFYASFLRNIYADKKASEDLLRSSGLDWTIVYPTMLTHGPAKGEFKAGDRLPMRGNPSISRADAAAFMYQAVHGTEWIGRSPVITD